MVELSSLLKFEDVSLSFGGITALKNVSGQAVNEINAYNPEED